MSTNRFSITDSLNAFCKDTDAYLQGLPNGSLSSLTFAAKDIFDVQGYIPAGAIRIGSYHKYRLNLLPGPYGSWWKRAPLWWAKP